MKKFLRTFVACQVLLFVLTITAYAQPANTDVIKGKVIETMNSGGYTYCLLDTGAGKKLWVAVPMMQVKAGAKVSFYQGSPMYNFKSTSLKKTFDEIIFSAGPVETQTQKQKQSPPKSSSSDINPKMKVTKAAGANAYTVGEIHQKRNSLNKKKITVSGKVVKFSPQIMKNNWIHIQDGTGEHIKGTHNLVITSKETVKVDDIVTLTGTLSIDRDFGGGYTYDVLIENATLKK